MLPTGIHQSLPIGRLLAIPIFSILSFLKKLIIQNDDNFSNLTGKCVSGGRVNAKKVLTALCADLNSTSTVLFKDETINTPNQRTFYYRIRATNRAGASAFSNIANASVPYTVPEAPTDLQGQSPAVYPLVNIYWSNHKVNALYNFIERRIPGYTNWEVIATLGYNADVYTDPSALPGYTYEYRIRAWNPLGYSDYSNIIAVEVIVW